VERRSFCLRRYYSRFIVVGQIVVELGGTILWMFELIRGQLVVSLLLYISLSFLGSLSIYSLYYAYS
jgi:hypothetical protein